jgi:Pectate lyase superfamily protein
MVWIPRWNSPKRKEDNENAVRRALLAGAFAAGASGLLTRKALADTPYTSFAYPLSSLPSMRQATATRTSLQRFADVFNVKDFGALGNNSHDDAAAIQAALNAAMASWGGIVYFPAGRYKITRRLEAGTAAHGGFNNGACLTLLGAGGNYNYESGSMIKGSFHDYLLYIGGPASIHSIQGLGFKQGGQFSFHSVLPPGNPGNLRSGGWEEPDTIPASEFDGGGCVYFGGSDATGANIINCDFQVHNGICLVLVDPFGSTILGTQFTGPGWNGNPYASFGIVCGGGFEISQCKIFGLGTCINTYNNASFEARHVTFEVSGTAFFIGSNPLGFWYGNPPQYHPPWTLGTSKNVSIRSCSTESMAHQDVIIGACDGLIIDGLYLSSFSQVGTPKTGLWIGWLMNAKITNLWAAGTYSDAGIDVCSGPHGMISSIVFENCTSHANAPAVGWKLPPGGAYAAGGTPTAYINCNTDGAVPLSQLPTGMQVMSGHPVTITDSTVPLWTGTASNVGRPAVGGGTNKVLVRWNPLLARWVLAG